MEKFTLDKQLVKVALELFRACGTKVSDQAAEKLQSGDLMGLVAMTVNPSDYTSAALFARDYAAVSFFKKCPLPLPIDRKKATMVKFVEAETMCYDTNRRFKRYQQNGPFEGLAELRCLEKLEIARGWVKQVLGRIPDALNCRFGPGSTYDDRGQLTTVPDKMSSVPTVTRDALDITKYHYYSTEWYRSRVTDARDTNPVEVRGNRFTTAPKNALTDRGICIEPSLNMFCQLGAGRHIRHRLRSHAWLDLVNAQPIHRDWAKRASLDGRHATLDLSMASDTIARELVRWLLPPEWFQLLDDLRSKCTHFDGHWRRNEKFSSMGNGFTFELETLIFASICFAAECGKSGTDYSVFGDDLIVPTDSASNVKAMLEFCGFKMNDSKSFVDGPFRESCGGDFFMGQAVRPYFLKELPYAPEHWIKMANALRRLAHSEHDRHFGYCYPFTAWLRCLDAIPSHIRRLRGPSQLGDLVIHDSTFNKRWRNGIGYVRVYRPLTKKIPWRFWTPSVMLATILYGPSDERGVTPRDSVSGYKVGWSVFS